VFINLKLRSQVRGVALAAFAASSGFAHSELLDIAWNASGQYEKTAIVQPGKFLELCGDLSKGQAIGWSFDADQALDFNLHFHEGKEVFFPAKQDAVKQASGTLNVAVKQDYCWMWSNKMATPAALSARLTR
jgi:hypothetical protein